jgi:hypothetical protein
MANFMMDLYREAGVNPVEMQYVLDPKTGKYVYQEVELPSKAWTENFGPRGVIAPNRVDKNLSNPDRRQLAFRLMRYKYSGMGRPSNYYSGSNDTGEGVSQPYTPQQEQQAMQIFQQARQGNHANVIQAVERTADPGLRDELIGALHAELNKSLHELFSSMPAVKLENVEGALRAVVDAPDTGALQDALGKIHPELKIKTDLSLDQARAQAAGLLTGYQGIRKAEITSRVPDYQNYVETFHQKAGTPEGAAQLQKSFDEISQHLARIEITKPAEPGRPPTVRLENPRESASLVGRILGLPPEHPEMKRMQEDIGHMVRIMEKVHRALRVVTKNPQATGQQLLEQLHQDLIDHSPPETTEEQT